MQDTNLVGSCGLYCRACPRYRVKLADGKYLMETQKDDYASFYCDGCHSDKLSEFCQSCKIRLCAKGKGIHHCGQCGDFPCVDLSAFADFGRTHDGAAHRTEVISNLERVNKDGMESWLMERDKRWRCSCGFPFSHYETICHACGKPLDSFAKPK